MTGHWDYCDYSAQTVQSFISRSASGKQSYYWSHCRLEHLPSRLLCGYLLGAVDDTLLIVVYNVADFVNKMAFVLACWSAANAESEENGDELSG